MLGICRYAAAIRIATVLAARNNAGVSKASNSAYFDNSAHPDA